MCVIASCLVLNLKDYSLQPLLIPYQFLLLFLYCSKLAYTEKNKDSPENLDLENCMSNLMNFLDHLPLEWNLFQLYKKYLYYGKYNHFSSKYKKSNICRCWKNQFNCSRCLPLVGNPLFQYVLNLEETPRVMLYLVRAKAPSYTHILIGHYFDWQIRSSFSRH